MKYDAIEVGKEYAIKYDKRGGPIRETCTGKLSGEYGKRIFFTDSSHARAGLVRTGVLPQHVIGPADEVFARLEDEEEEARRVRHAAVAAQQEVNKQRQAVVKRLQSCLGSLRHADTKDRFKAYGHTEAQQRCVDVDFEDLDALLDMVLLPHKVIE